jgi:hypothetical protein
MPPVDPKDLSVKDLKSWLIDITADHSEEIGPCLYWLRAKLKAQGARNDLKSKREGFGPWVEANLHITRKTADKWADDWAIEEGLLKPKKTFSKATKSSGDGSGVGDDLGGRTGPLIIYYNMTLKITETQQEELISAWETLGDDHATQLVLDTLVAAAKAANPKPADTFKMDLGELDAVKVR